MRSRDRLRMLFMMEDGTLDYTERLLLLYLLYPIRSVCSGACTLEYEDGVLLRSIGGSAI